MNEEGSSITLIFYRIQPKWWREPALNVISAAAQMSNLTHVEISIGGPVHFLEPAHNISLLSKTEESGESGQMKHVARIFNDAVGVELVERTGRNPQNIYLQLGCSKHAEHRMLSFVKNHCVGKPFSNMAMVLSLLWPRQTDCASFFCAELVAAILKEGGLMDTHSNPGSATPEMLHRIYAPRAAVAANPCVLRDVQASSLHFNATLGTQAYPGMSERAAEHEHHLTQRAVLANTGGTQPAAASLASHPLRFAIGRRRAASPTRGHFREVGRNQYSGTGVCTSRIPPAQPSVQLTLNSLDFATAARMRRT